MTIGERIKEQRKIKKLTQNELAIKADIGTGTVRQYESGRRQPQIAQLHKIAQALDVPFASLADVSDEAIQSEISAAITKKLDTTNIPHIVAEMASKLTNAMLINPDLVGPLGELASKLEAGTDLNTLLEMAAFLERVQNKDKVQ